MCKLKSAIILEDRVFIPDYDSHSQMLAELGIKDTQENAERLFVRAELSPQNGDVFSPVDEWVFTVDQDILPNWFVSEYEKQRMVNAVKLWAKDRIHMGVDELSINTGRAHYIKDCKNVYIDGNATVGRIIGNATVRHISGSATVEYISENAKVKRIGGNATVEYISGDVTVECIRGYARVNYISGEVKVNYIIGDAKVECISENAKVKCIGGSATVDGIRGDVTVECISDNAMVIGSSSGWKNKNKVIMMDDSTFKDFKSKIIYQAGNWRFERANSCTKEET